MTTAVAPVVTTPAAAPAPGSASTANAPTEGAQTKVSAPEAGKPTQTKPPEPQRYKFKRKTGEVEKSHDEVMRDLDVLDGLRSERGSFSP